VKRIGILVGEKGDWRFFNDIYEDIKAHYETVVHTPKTYNFPLLHGRLNRWSFSHEIHKVLQKSDVSFFEWASELLVPASHMPKYGPIITRLHSYELYAWAPDVNWDNVDKIILVSKAMQEKFNDLYPGHAHKTEVVYNAKPLDKFKPAKRDFGHNLGMLCEINPRKRIYEIILMTYDLIQRGYNIYLHIGGARKHAPDCDEYYVALHRLINKLGIADNVTFYDHITDTVSWLQKMDIFISNSYWEGHQVALIEAMATGCYSLSHFWDGAEEVLPAENIYSLETELAEKIIEYFNLPDNEKLKRTEQMRKLANEKYDSTEQHVRIRRIIEEVCNGASVGSSY